MRCRTTRSTGRGVGERRGEDEGAHGVEHSSSTISAQRTNPYCIYTHTHLHPHAFTPLWTRGQYQDAFPSSLFCRETLCVVGVVRYCATSKTPPATQAGRSKMAGKDTDDAPNDDSKTRLAKTPPAKCAMQFSSNKRALHM